jgi:hypothetical protein
LKDDDFGVDAGGKHEAIVGGDGDSEHVGGVLGGAMQAECRSAHSTT